MNYFLLFISLFNTILLIGIAGSLVRSLRSKNPDVLKKDWMNIVKSRSSLDVQTRIPNYSEFNPNWDGMPKDKSNWDGISKK